MSILTTAQIAAAARDFANTMFVIPGVVANLSLDRIISGITAIDNVMSMTPAAFATAYGSSFNVGSGFGAAVAAAVPESTTAQQGVMLIFWVQQVTGLHP